MKNKLTSLSVILLVSAAVLGVMPSARAQPPLPSIWIEPATLNFNMASTHVGDKFNVTVWAGTAGDVYVYQAEVLFNVTQLQAVRAGYTGGAGSQWWKGHVTVLVALGIDNVKGTVVGGESLLGLDAVHASSGSLFWVEFQIITAPTPGNTLTSLIDTNDVSNSFLLDADLNQLNSVLDHATYTFSGPPPARHQVLVNSVTPSSGQVYQGSSMSIAVVVLNNGTVTETFDVNATYDGAVIGNQTVTSLVAGGTQTLTFIWNTVGVAAGNYTLTATATPITGQTDLTSISKTANVAVLMSRHQVVVSSVNPSSANVTQGFSVSLSVLVLNNGTATETSVAVNATADGILIGQQTVPSLGAGNTTTLTFIWNTVGVSVGNYTVTATVTPVANQTDLVGISQSVTIHVLAMSVGQYYLTVTSLYDSPTPQSSWFNSGTNITESVTSPTSSGADIRNICTGWTGTGNVPASGTSSTVSFAITMNSTITWNWKTQYYLHVSSVYGSPSPLSGWFDFGSSITESVSSPVSDGSGVQHVCTGWTGSGSVPSSGFSLSFTFTINAASSVTWNWKTQYYLNVSSVYGSPSPLSGWFDSGSSITESVASPVPGGSGQQYVCTSWSGTGSVLGSGNALSLTFAISTPSTIAWNWKTQYYLTVSSPTGTTTDQGWYDNGSTVYATLNIGAIDYGNGTRQLFTSWGADASGTNSSQSDPIMMNRAKTADTLWRTQYYLHVSSVYGSPSPLSGWFDFGSSITESVSSPVSDGSGVQHVCTGWTGSGSVPVSGSGSFVTFTVSAVSSIAWSWKTQYQVKFDQSGVSPAFKGTVMAIDSVNYSEDNLPLSFWWDNGSSHSFSFVSPLAVASTEYVWNSTVGLSSLQSGTLTVTDSGSIVGDYAARTSQPPQPAQPFLPPLLILLSAFGLALLGACVLSVFLGVFKKIQVGGRQQKGS